MKKSQAAPKQNLTQFTACGNKRFLQRLILFYVCGRLKTRVHYFTVRVYESSDVWRFTQCLQAFLILSRFYVLTLLSHHTVVWGYLVCMHVCLFFVCTVTDFWAAGKDKRREILHACLTTLRTFFCHFGELWLAWSHGGSITSGMNYTYMLSSKTVW